MSPVVAVLPDGSRISFDDSASDQELEALNAELKRRGITSASQVKLENAQEVKRPVASNPMQSIVGLATGGGISSGVKYLSGGGGRELLKNGQSLIGGGEAAGPDLVIPGAATESGGLFSSPYAGPAGAAGLYGISRSEDLRYGGGKGAAAEGASGALAGYAVGGPVGAIIGGGLGAIRGFTHGPSKTKKEEKDRQKLAQQGILVPNAGVKEWELNDKFKNSRNENDLGGGDIKNAATFYLRYGKDYSNLPDSKRAAIGQEALNRKLVREHKGRVDVAYDEDFDKYVKGVIAEGNKGVAKSNKQGENKSGKRKASPETQSSAPSAPQADPVIIPGPAVTTANGGPSQFQPVLISPEEYTNRYREMLKQRNYKGL